MGRPLMAGTEGLETESLKGVALEREGRRARVLVWREQVYMNLL